VTTVGIKELKARLSQFLTKAAAGEKVIITDRGAPIALLTTVPPEMQALSDMRRQGKVSWSGRKPDGLPATARRKRRKGNPDVSGAVIQDRER